MVHCSIIFDVNKDFVVGDNINFGGTGVSLETELPEEIEMGEPDYSLYPENDTSYGFMTRGCIRNCYFCKVPKKEGKIRLVNEPEDIIRHKKVKFFDNNILAYNDHKRILQKLIDIGIPMQFNQGLDIRLLNKENSDLIRRLHYMNEIGFAFDDISEMDILNRKIGLLDWCKKWQVRFFVYVNPNMEISNVVRRIEWLTKHECLPYLMRDISCWDSPMSQFYTDLAAWCNQPGFFKSMEFDTFLEKRHKNIDRIAKHKILYNENKGQF